MYWHLSACAHFFVRDVLALTPLWANQMPRRRALLLGRWSPVWCVPSPFGYRTAILAPRPTVRFASQSIKSAPGACGGPAPSVFFRLAGCGLAGRLGDTLAVAIR